MLTVILAALLAALPLVDRDNVIIAESGTVAVAEGVLVDIDNDGVVQIRGDGLTVDFGGATLRGAAEGVPRDTFLGVGVHVSGRNITVRNLKLAGYKVGLLADGCDGLTLENVEVLSGFGQRLSSTLAAESTGDWLWPHRNDNDEWLTGYGAGLCVKNSSQVRISGVKVRNTQNGIILSRVQGSSLYDNDCSFLSGWGLALWRSSDNVISRNAFDFCVRGYSHGVYNRGQDSAGILLFEQSNRNIIVENSATHGGDGLFGFAGREALGEAPAPSGTDETFYHGRGCNGNTIVRNDFSYAVAHGLEMTFSFDNVIVSNRFTGCGISGIWGGYSRRTLIAANRFADNSEGVSIEHGVANRIEANVFQRNRVGVSLWWDEDEALFRTPWAAANGVDSANNLILANSFEGDGVAIRLLATKDTIVAGNRFAQTPVEMEVDEASKLSLGTERPEGLRPIQAVDVPTPGTSTPVGARRDLAGRQKIIMTEWGPYDWSSPMLQAVQRQIAEDTWAVLGAAPIKSSVVHGSGPLRTRVDPIRQLVRVYVEQEVPDIGWLTPYNVRVALEDGSVLEGPGVLLKAQWSVTLFHSPIDPRDDLAAWRQDIARGATFLTEAIDFRFGTGGPREVAADVLAVPADTTVGEVREKLLAMDPDRFGTVATATIKMPQGRWLIKTSSDDGIRVWIDDRLIIDNWTWHVPTVDQAVVEIKEPWETKRLRVEHFELDGVAELRLWAERAPASDPAEEQ